MVVLFYKGAHIIHAAVAYFDGVFVEDFVVSVVRGEVLSGEM